MVDPGAVEKSILAITSNKTKAPGLRQRAPSQREEGKNTESSSPIVKAIPSSQKGKESPRRHKIRRTTRGALAQGGS